MCALCGVLGVESHWSDAVARAGVYTRNTIPHGRRRDRQRRIAIANRFLSLYGLKLSDWHGRSYVLSTATGKSKVIATLTHLWPAAEQLSGRAFDPLEPDFLARLVSR